MLKNLGEFFVFLRCEFTEYEIEIADFVPLSIVGGTNAKTRKIFGAEMGDEGFKAIIATCATLFAETDFAKNRPIFADVSVFLRG